MLIESSSPRGLILSLDRRKIKQPYVLEGKNFMADVDGPKTSFVTQQKTLKPLANGLHAAAFTTDAATVSWVATDTCILQYDPTSYHFLPVLALTGTAEEFPWTTALVGGDQYFARRGIGLLRYQTATGEWTQMTGGSIPALIDACCLAGGRLVVMAEGLVAWSAIDDGTDMVPSTSTGAGFQSLAKVGAYKTGNNLGLYSLPSGFMAFTTYGILLGEVVDSLNPFRFDVLAQGNDSVPLNAFCIAAISDHEYIYLAATGFFSTGGQTPVPWQPIAGEYFRLHVIPPRQFINRPLIMISSLLTTKQVFVSIADEIDPTLYQVSYVYSPISDQWGIFNKQHRAIVEYVTEAGGGAGFFCVQHCFREFIDSATGIRFAGEDEFVETYRVLVQYPTRYEAGIYKFNSVMRMTQHNEGVFSVSNVYQIDYPQEYAGDTPTEPVQANSVLASPTIFSSAIAMSGVLIKIAPAATVPKVSTASDSFVKIGLYQIPQNQNVDETSEINNIMVGMPNASDAATGVIYDDWLLDYDVDQFNDWLAETGAEDWGLEVAGVLQYDITIESSLDGYTQIADIDPSVELVETTNSQSVYSCQSAGFWHAIYINALTVGQAFDIKSLNLSGISTGRLQ